MPASVEGSAPPEHFGPGGMNTPMTLAERELMSDQGSTPPPPPPGSGDGGYSAPPPPPPGSGDGGYAAPPPPMGGMGGPVDHPKGMTVLVLGILSLVCCSPLGIVALIMGNNALKEIDAQPGRYGNRQIVQIGRILGIIGIVFLVISIIWLLFLGGLAAISGDSSSM